MDQARELAPALDEPAVLERVEVNVVEPERCLHELAPGQSQALLGELARLRIRRRVLDLRQHLVDDAR